MMTLRALLIGTRCLTLALCLGVSVRPSRDQAAVAGFVPEPVPAGNEFEGADLNRRGQARLLRQGAEGDLFGQRRRDPGRHEADLLGDDDLSRPLGEDGRGRPTAGPCAPQANRAAGPPQNSGIKRLEASGPVTVVSKTQVATGDNGTYDKLEDKVYLIGHVTLSDGQNVTKGDKLIYDMKTGQATIDTGSGKSGRVHGQFTPTSTSGADPSKAK